MSGGCVALLRQKLGSTQVPNDRNTSMRMGTLAATAVLAAALSAGLAAGASGASLEETVQHALTTNPDILQAAANRRALDNELNQANGLYLPQIDFKAAVGPEWSNNSTTRARGGRGTNNFNDSPGTWMRRAESSLTLQQKIFDGWASRSEEERHEPYHRARLANLLHRDHSPLPGHMPKMHRIVHVISAVVRSPSPLQSSHGLSRPT